MNDYKILYPGEGLKLYIKTIILSIKYFKLKYL